MEKPQNDIINQLIVNYLTEEISPPQLKQLEDWRSESEDNQAYYERFRKAYELVNARPGGNLPDIDIDVEWGHFLQQVSESREVPIQTATGNSWLRYAAMISLVVLGASIIGFFLTREQAIQVATAGESQSINLPDGSTIELNRFSEISYTSGFGEAHREINLKGEAFFNVASDKDRPFVIMANETRTEVIGTQFNVQAYDDLESVEVVVEEGVVRFSSNQDQVELTAGEKGTYSKSSNTLTEEPNDDINYLSWKTRSFVFVQSDLQSVIATLNRVYGDRLVIASSISDSCEVTVSFDQQELEAIMRVLEATLNLTLRTTGEKIEILDAECN